MNRFKLDPLMIKLLITVLLATFIPARGDFIVWLKWLTAIAIAALFFMHGAKLSRQDIIAGSRHWRLHAWVMCSTFVIFPLLGILLVWWHPVDIDPQIYTGFLYLSILPATVQSSIALTSLAGGNVAAAVCSASASSLAGIFISPLLAGFLLGVHQDNVADQAEQIGKIVLQLLVPFISGHLARRWIGEWVEKNRKLISKTDQSSILLVVFAAFSEAVSHGLWSRVGEKTLLLIILASTLMIVLILLINLLAARLFGFSHADKITILFCGSKKSLVNGIPMANILFPAAAVGIIVLPLMIFHQIQLLICSWLAQRYSHDAKKPPR